MLTITEKTIQIKSRKRVDSDKSLQICLLRKLKLIPQKIETDSQSSDEHENSKGEENNSREKTVSSIVEYQMTPRDEYISGYSDQELADFVAGDASKSIEADIELMMEQDMVFKQSIIDLKGIYEMKKSKEEVLQVISWARDFDTSLENNPNYKKGVSSE